jgi:hypothetical protein
MVCGVTMVLLLKMLWRSRWRPRSRSQREPGVNPTARSLQAGGTCGEAIFTAASPRLQPHGGKLASATRRGRLIPEVFMSSIVKVLEVIAQSKKSFDDAAQQAVREAAGSVRGIKSIWIENFSGVVEGDRIVEYRVNAKLSFLVEEHK